MGADILARSGTPETAVDERFSPIVVHVGFAGHRSVDTVTLERSLAHTFALIQGCVYGVGRTLVDKNDNRHQSETVLDAHAAIWGVPADKPALNLLTGYAPGADRSAAQVWARAGVGRIHALFPFADGSQQGRQHYAWTHGPEQTDTSLRVNLVEPEGLPGGFSWTVLDGALGLEEMPPRDAHLEQARWLTRWSDLMVVAWNGRPAAGPGGTADVVEMALAAATPIVWIQTSSPDMPVRLIGSERLWRDGVMDELLEALNSNRIDEVAPILVEQDLRKMLVSRLAPPRQPHQGNSGDQHEESAGDVDARRSYNMVDPFAFRPGPLGHLDKLQHAASRLLSRLWSQLWSRQGDLTPGEQPVRTRDTTQWPRTAMAHREIELALERAEERAAFHGDLHRSTQLGLLCLAVLAVFFGTLPAVFPEAKLAAVVIELLLIVVASLAWSYMVRRSSHQLWGDSRRLAERLRALRATWPLGLDVADSHKDAPATWTEWQVRAIRRVCGPPLGFMEQARRRAAAELARTDPAGIVDGQRAYHTKNARRSTTLHHRLHHAERVLLGLLLVSLCAYLGWYWIASLLDAKVPALAGGILLQLSALVPTCAAVCLAIEAKLDLRESAHHSNILGHEFARINYAMYEAAQPQRDEEMLRAAANLMLADVDDWRDASLRRVLATLG